MGKKYSNKAMTAALDPNSGINAKPVPNGPKLGKVPTGPTGKGIKAR